MITIDVNGAELEVPSSAADTNWAAKQVAFEQAVVEYIDETVESLDNYVTENTFETLEQQVEALDAATTPAACAGTPAETEGISGASTNYGRHVVHKITANYLAAIALGVGPEADITLWTLPAKTRVLRVVADVTTPFLGGAINAVTMKVGRAGAADDFLLPADVYTNPITVGNTQDELGDNVQGGTGFVGDMQWSTQLVVLNLVSANGDLSLLEQGSVTVYVETCTYP